MPAKRKTNGGGGGEKWCSWLKNFCLWLLYLLALVSCQSCKWCQVDLIITDLDLYRSCVEEWIEFSEARTMMTPRPGWNWLLEGGQLVRIWGYWHHNQVIGMGGYFALMVMVSQWYCIHTSIHHHISVHCPLMTCCHCSLGLEDNCHVLVKLTWGLRPHPWKNGNSGGK